MVFGLVTYTTSIKISGNGEKKNGESFEDYKSWWEKRVVKWKKEIRNFMIPFYVSVVVGIVILLYYLI